MDLTWIPGVGTCNLDGCGQHTLGEVSYCSDECRQDRIEEMYGEIMEDKAQVASAGELAAEIDRKLHEDDD